MHVLYEPLPPGYLHANYKVSAEFYWLIIIITIFFGISGNARNLKNKILDPHFLSKVSKTFDALNKTIDKHGPWAHAWVGEAGGAYNSGGHLVSDAFIDSFW